MNEGRRTQLSRLLACLVLLLGGIYYLGGHKLASKDYVANIRKPLVEAFPFADYAGSSPFSGAQASASESPKRSGQMLPATSDVPKQAELELTKAKAWTPYGDPEEVRKARRVLEEQSLVPLGGEAGSAFLLGVRAETGTVEVVSPTSVPDFSYTLPLRDKTVRLHCAYLDWTAPSYSHLTLSTAQHPHCPSPAL